MFALYSNNRYLSIVQLIVSPTLKFFAKYLHKNIVACNKCMQGSERKLKTVVLTKRTYSILTALVTHDKRRAI